MTTKTRECTLCNGTGRIQHKTGIPGPNVIKKYITEMCPVCEGPGKRPVQPKET